MLYDLMGRLARIGGESSLTVLFVMSVICTALIGDRIWFFARRQLDIDNFARQLLVPLRNRKWSAAQEICETCAASPAQVVLAGLSQADHGRAVVEAVMHSSSARERLRLENYLGLIRALGYAAIMVGLLGTVLDLWEFVNSPALVNWGKSHATYQAVSVLAPLSAGLLIAAPTLFVGSVLSLLGQKTLLEIEFISQFVLSQLTTTEANSIDTAKPFTVRAA